MAGGGRYLGLEDWRTATPCKRILELWGKAEGVQVDHLIDLSIELYANYSTQPINVSFTPISLTATYFNLSIMLPSVALYLSSCTVSKSAGIVEMLKGLNIGASYLERHM